MKYKWVPITSKTVLSKGQIVKRHFRFVVEYPTASQVILKGPLNPTKKELMGLEHMPVSITFSTTLKDLVESGYLQRVEVVQLGGKKPKKGQKKA